MFQEIWLARRRLRRRSATLMCSSFYSGNPRHIGKPENGHFFHTKTATMIIIDTSTPQLATSVCLPSRSRKYIGRSTVQRSWLPCSSRRAVGRVTLGDGSARERSAHEENDRQRRYRRPRPLCDARAANGASGGKQHGRQLFWGRPNRFGC